MAKLQAKVPAQSKQAALQAKTTNSAKKRKIDHGSEPASTTVSQKSFVKSSPTKATTSVASAKAGVKSAVKAGVKSVVKAGVKSAVKAGVASVKAKAGAKAGLKAEQNVATTTAASKPAAKPAANNGALQKLLKLSQALKLKLVRPCVQI